MYVGLASPGYLGTIAVLSGALLALPLLAGGAAGVGSMGMLILVLLAIVPASDLAIALLNRTVAALVTPAVLPRLALLDGVPAELRTLVAVPMLLTDVAEIDAQIERLEVHYLANPDGDVRFAILSDWTDATAASAARRRRHAGRRSRGDRPPERAVMALLPMVARASCSSIAAGSGTRASRRGWDGSASGASCTS